VRSPLRRTPLRVCRPLGARGDWRGGFLGRPGPSRRGGGEGCYPPPAPQAGRSPGGPVPRHSPAGGGGKGADCAPQPGCRAPGPLPRVACSLSRQGHGRLIRGLGPAPPASPPFRGAGGAPGGARGGSRALLWWQLMPAGKRGRPQRGEAAAPRLGPCCPRGCPRGGPSVVRRRRRLIPEFPPPPLWGGVAPLVAPIAGHYRFPFNNFKFF
jgi:hypothetical protein